MVPNIPEMLVANFGVPLAGAVLVAINTRLSPEEVQYVCDHSGATVLVVDTEYLPALAPVSSSLRTVREVIAVSDLLGPAAHHAVDPAYVGYDDFMKRGTGEPLPWTVEDETSLISINYSSGTTGQPKGAMYTHRGAYLNAMGEIIHQRFDPESVYLWTLPMFHCNGWCTPWAVTGIGATHVCLRAVRADVIWHLHRRRRRDPSRRCSDRADDDRRGAAGAPAGTRARCDGRGRCAESDGDREDARARCADRPRLRHDRALRSLHAERVAGGLGGPCRRPTRHAARPARASR